MRHIFLLSVGLFLMQPWDSWDVCSEGDIAEGRRRDTLPPMGPWKMGPPFI